MWTLSSHFQQNPWGRMHFIPWQWFLKARYVCQNFPRTFLSRQQPSSILTPHAAPEWGGLFLLPNWHIWGGFPPRQLPVVLGPTAVPVAGLSRSDVNGITLPRALKMKEKPGQTGPDKHSASSPSSAEPTALPTLFPNASPHWRKPRSPLSSPSPLPQAIHPI